MKVNHLKRAIWEDFSKIKKEFIEENFLELSFVGLKKVIQDKSGQSIVSFNYLGQNISPGDSINIISMLKFWKSFYDEKKNNNNSINRLAIIIL